MIFDVVEYRELSQLVFGAVSVNEKQTKSVICDLQCGKSCEARNAISQFTISQSLRGSGSVVHEKLQSEKCIG